MAIGPLTVGVHFANGNNGGGYLPGDTGYIVQGANQSATFTIVSVGVDGDVAFFNVTSAGSGYDDLSGIFLATINIIGTGANWEPSFDDVPIDTSGGSGSGYGNSFF